MKCNLITHDEQNEILYLSDLKEQRPFFEQLLLTINDASLHHTIIELTLYDEQEELKVIGTVEQIDTSHIKIKIDGEWFPLNRVVAFKNNNAC